MLLSDPNIVRRVQNEFIPATGEHILLSRGAFSQWYVGMVQQARPGFRGPNQQSTQGYYVVGADGTGVLHDANTFSVERLNQFLDRGLQRWRQAGPRAASTITPEQQRQAEPVPPPPGTSVIRLFTRIRPVPAGAHFTNQRLGLDYMWITQEEVRQLAQEGNSGQPFALPTSMVSRMVLFHMVDNVRGQVPTYQPQSVSRATFNARAAGGTGNMRRFTFAGDYAKRDSRPPRWNDRGQEGRVEGEFEVDVSASRITRLRAVAESQGWSDATFSPYPPPSGRYPIVCALIEANDDIAQRVTPEPAAQGNTRFYLQAMVPGSR